MAFSILLLRVSFCLAVIIETIQSRRAIGVMSSHADFAFGTVVRALRKSAGALGQNDLMSNRFVGFMYLFYFSCIVSRNPSGRPANLKTVAAGGAFDVEDVADEIEI